MSSSGKAVLVTITALLITSLARSGESGKEQYRVSGPYKHNNLTVFLLHSDDAGRSENLLTLEEAMEDGSITVFETGNVSELMIENRSSRPVFVNSGDIVKGGRQDRLLRYDLVIKPHSGKIPLPSFCVEGGRWSQRGDEDAASFGQANYMIAGKEIKLAAKEVESQQEVWSEISKIQDSLSAAAELSVRGGRSATSLQLTLEHGAVDSLSREYVDVFSAEVDRRDDIVGFAFAINGQINSADIYRSSDLFKRMWPKLIRSGAVEAASVIKANKSKSEITVSDIETWLANAEDAEVSEKEVNESIRLVVKRGKNDVIFETFDSNTGELIHKNCLRR